MPDEPALARRVLGGALPQTPPQDAAQDLLSRARPAGMPIAVMGGSAIALPPISQRLNQRRHPGRAP
jgi:hypothetical protein